MTEQEKFWQATKDQHEAGQELLRRIERFKKQETIVKLATYLRTELAEIEAIARKAVV